MSESKGRPNCSIGGCKGPFTCETCGFDHREAARRRHLPFFLFSDGLVRMIVPGSSPGEDPKPIAKLQG